MRLKHPCLPPISEKKPSALLSPHLNLFNWCPDFRIGLRGCFVSEERGSQGAEELGRCALGCEVGLIVVEEEDELQHGHRVFLLPARSLLIW